MQAGGKAPAVQWKGGGAGGDKCLCGIKNDKTFWPQVNKYANYTNNCGPSSLGTVEIKEASVFWTRFPCL